MKVFRQQPIFTLVSIASAQFVVLTLLAMWLYPGGTLRDPTTTGYDFFVNFFSDLGTLTTYNGADNTASSVLFVVALTLAGLGLTAFFLTLPVFFQSSSLTRLLSLLGSTAGVLAGLSFVGIALTPADLYVAVHTNFVYAAFTALLVVVVFYFAAILRTAVYPNRYAAAYLLFAVLLAAYLWLLFYGPAANTLSGLRIQATGQKIIAYAAVVITLVQARGAHRLAQQSMYSPSASFPSHLEDSYLEEE